MTEENQPEIKLATMLRDIKPSSLLMSVRDIKVMAVEELHRADSEAQLHRDEFLKSGKLSLLMEHEYMSTLLPLLEESVMIINNREDGVILTIEKIDGFPESINLIYSRVFK